MCSKWTVLDHENIPGSDRKYCLCQDDAVGDEYQYPFECYFFSKRKTKVHVKCYYIS